MNEIRQNFKDGALRGRKEQQVLLEKNADNANLMPLTGLIPSGSQLRSHLGPRVYIGHVDEVNGNGAREFPAFVPTRFELLQLLEFWEDTFLERTFFVFTTRQVGSTDTRLCPFAERRINRIIELLGDDAVETIAAVRKRFGQKIGSLKWRQFNDYLGPNHNHHGVDVGEIVRLRSAGLSWPEIASRTGLGQGTAYRAYQMAVDEPACSPSQNPPLVRNSVRRGMGDTKRPPSQRKSKSPTVRGLKSETE